jgi:hypothetical protein
MKFLMWSMGGNVVNVINVDPPSLGLRRVKMWLNHQNEYN